MSFRAMDRAPAWIVAFAVGVVLAPSHAQDPREKAERTPREVILAALDGETFDARAMESLVGLGVRGVPALIDVVRTSSYATAEEQRRDERAHTVIRSLPPDAMRAAARGLAGVVTLDSGRFDAEAVRTFAAMALTAHLHGDGELSRILDDANRARLEGLRLVDARSLLFTVPEDAPRDAQGRQHWQFSGVFYARHQRAAAPSWAWQRIHVRATSLHGATDSDLLAALDDREPFVRELAATMLGHRGERSPELLDALRRSSGLERDPSETGELIRCAVATALARLAPNDPASRRGLTLLLRADDPRERATAAMAIRASDEPGAFDVVPALLEASADDDPLVAAESITALGRVGVAREEVILRLREFAERDDAFGARARCALRRLQPDGGRR